MGTGLPAGRGTHAEPRAGRPVSRLGSERTTQRCESDHGPDDPLAVLLDRPVRDPSLHPSPDPGDARPRQPNGEHRERSLSRRHIPGATYVELPGSDHPVCLSDAEQILDEIEEMVTGERRAVDVDRVVASIVFTDIVGSTERVIELGDRRWHELLDEHDRLVRSELRRFSGREVKTTGDGFMASFDGATSAVRCAQAIIDSVGRTGLSVRAGVHTGECEVRHDDLSGLAVHIAARVGAVAGPDEVLVSSVVRGLSAGAGITFTLHGVYILKGIPGDWELFSATPSPST